MIPAVLLVTFVLLAAAGAAGAAWMVYDGFARVRRHKSEPEYDIGA